VVNFTNQSTNLKSKIMISLYVMAIVYIGAGMLHFVNPKFFLDIMPTYIPLKFHDKIVQISGVFEIVLGAMLIPEATRVMGAWGLVALLIAVFPANIQMCVTFWQKKNPFFWGTVARLPIQFVLIWWAWLYTH
jgi:uncharacterized membrane protein